MSVNNIVFRCPRNVLIHTIGFVMGESLLKLPKEGFAYIHMYSLHS